MSIAGGIRAGMAFVEIKAHDTEFQASMLRFQERMVGVGASMRKLGTQVGVFAGALAVPMVAGIRASQGFDDALRGLQASVADLTPDQLEAIRKESLRLAAALATAPEDVANQFLNLAKAGVSVDDALAGAAQAAVLFSRVGGMQGGQAAELLADLMNTFGESAMDAAGIMAAAANASSVDINQMREAMAMAGAVAGMAGQDLADTSAALAILGKGMLKGSDAGTSLKTMLMRLTSPMGEAKTAMAELGLTVRSFTDDAEKPLRLPAMIDVLNQRLGKLNAVARRDVMARLFGQDSIRAAELLTRAGREGFDAMLGAMKEAVPLTQQFQYLTAGVAGFFSALEVGAKLLSIAFQSSLGPSLQVAGRGLIWVSEKLAWMIEHVPGLGPALAGVAAAATALSVAMFAVAAGSALVNFTMTNLPLKAVTALALAASAAFSTLSGAAFTLAAAIYAIPGIGWIAGIVTALGALGAAAWWFYSKDKTTKAPQRARQQPGGAMPAADQFQAAMAAPGPGRGRGPAPPLLASGEQQALSMRRVERLLEELVDISRGQRPAWG